MIDHSHVGPQPSTAIYCTLQASKAARKRQRDADLASNETAKKTLVGFRETALDKLLDDAAPSRKDMPGAGRAPPHKVTTGTELTLSLRFVGVDGWGFICNGHSIDNHKNDVAPLATRRVIKWCSIRTHSQTEATWGLLTGKLIHTLSFSRDAGWKVCRLHVGQTCVGEGGRSSRQLVRQRPEAYGGKVRRQAWPQHVRRQALPSSARRLPRRGWTPLQWMGGDQPLAT
jgi:hypothetical protein